jgi:hypothetical protein
MSAALIDHLWQSWLCVIAIALLLPLLRGSSARVRLWMWRIATLKFLAPFSALYTAGIWLGFPVTSPGDPPPAALLRLFALLNPALAPAKFAALHGLAAWALLAFELTLTIAWSLHIARQMRVEHNLAQREIADAETGMSAPVPAMGFFKAALLTTCTLGTLTGTVLAGAVEDRQHRHAVLLTNLQSLRKAPVAIELAKPGMGERSRVFANQRGILIRNINLHELIALAYGVSPFAVMSNQMISRADADPRDFWLFSPRYDVRVSGIVHEPEIFESYALHAVITRMLAEKFGLEINVNGECQRPCGRFDYSALD